VPPFRPAKPFLNWAGNKRHIAKSLLNLGIPNFHNYHEPFLGSGAFFLALASTQKIHRAFLSDQNAHLISMFAAVKKDPEGVIRALKLHKMLDSDVHFAGVIGDLNRKWEGEEVSSDHAAAVIYAMAHSFHSSWYELPNGKVSISRRANPKPFNPHLDRVSEAAYLLESAEFHCQDFRASLGHVSAGDLVFIDPPYLAEKDVADRRAYTADRFSQQDLRDLLDIIEHSLAAGAHVVFCWGYKLLEDVFQNGNWRPLNNSYVWTSFGS